MVFISETKKFESEGFLSYEERTRAWTLLRFKREMTFVFPFLKDRQARMKYRLKVFLSLQAFEEFSKKVLEKQLPVPVVLYFERDDEKES